MFYISAWANGTHDWFGPFADAESAKDHYDADERYDAFDFVVVIGPLPIAATLKE